MLLALLKNNCGQSANAWPKLQNRGLIMEPPPKSWWPQEETAAVNKRMARFATHTWLFQPFHTHKHTFISNIVHSALTVCGCLEKFRDFLLSLVYCNPRTVFGGGKCETKATKTRCSNCWVTPDRANVFRFPPRGHAVHHVCMSIHGHLDMRPIRLWRI